jgi:hypothetical protein
MYSVAVGLFFAALFVATYLLIKTLIKPAGNGRSRWRSLITPTTVDSFPVTQEQQYAKQFPVFDVQPKARKTFER